MENNVILRINSLPSFEWRDELNKCLESVGLAEEVKIVPMIPPLGVLGDIDPTTVNAIIAGGSQIVAAVIAVLGVLLINKPKASSIHQKARTLVINVIGDKGNRTINIQQNEFDNLIDIIQSHMRENIVNKRIVLALKDVGTVRKVEVISEAEHDIAQNKDDKYETPC